jgi:DNA-binding NarL/FixJ family response regulator
VRRVVRDLFEPQEDFEICGEAIDGRDAIDKAERFCPDLIILDLSMPVMNGLQAARIIRRSNPKVSIILLTLHEQSIVDSEASAAGIDRLVSKADMIDLVRHARGIFTPEGPAAASQES